MLILIGSGFITACGDGGGSTNDQLRPILSATRVELNPLNSLSTLVTFDAANADLARVLYWEDGDPQQATPFFPIQNGTNTIATLDLRPSTSYFHMVEASGPVGNSESETMQFVSGELPPSLLNVRLDAAGIAESGYTLTSVFLDNSTACVVAFQNEDVVRWYRCFEEGVRPSETKLQPNGNFTVFLGQTSGFQPTPGRFVEFHPSGEIVREYLAEPPLFTDNHELLFSMNGAELEFVHFFGYELRTTDLSRFGGQPDAQLAGHLLLRQSPDGSDEFIWNAWDHLSVDDWIEPPEANKQLPNVDFDHPNSLDFDRDGNYIVSFRNLGEITKIDAVTGTILWRFGGRNNQFAILNDPFGGFSAQHSVRVLENGNLLIYDNGSRHNPPETRAVEYAIDLSAMTATLVWEYRHSPAIFTPFVGGVQRLANGDTLVAFGGVGHVDQVGPDGTVVWEADFSVNGEVRPIYRAVRIRSLYEFQRP